jgi:hypothetical protein
MSLNNPVPLSVLALELDTTRTKLEAQLAGQHFADDLGRRAVDRDTARHLIGDHHAAQEAAAEIKRRQIQRLAAETAAAHEKIRRGVPVGPSGLPAIAGYDPPHQPPPRPHAASTAHLPSYNPSAGPTRKAGKP